MRRVATRVNRDEATVGEIVEATLEEIEVALKRGESVSLRDVGSLPISASQRGALDGGPTQR